LRGPPITIRCECGKTKEVAYGERWRCEACGRSWNTRQIPPDEYEGLLRRMRRHKLEALAMVAIAAAVIVPLIVVVSSSFIMLVPMVMAAWLFLVLPFWRRRYRRTARAAPRWELHPD
jgi:Flp pilus assembly protein TadB